MTQLHWPPSQGSPTYTKLTHTPITAADTVDTLLWHVHTADKTVLSPPRRWCEQAIRAFSVSVA